MNQEYLTLIIRCLEGSIQAEESKKLESWLHSDIQNRVVFEEIKQHWEGKSALQKGYAEQPAWEQLSKRLDIQLYHREGITQLRPIRKRNWHWPQVAAVFVGFLMVISLVYWWVVQDRSITYSTHSKQITTIWLPDSSLVTLFENSTLSYRLTPSHREVILYGKAFFDVKKQNNTPFLVKTTHLDVRVLGTSFDVKSYQEDENVETTLITGSVEISSKDENGKVSEKRVLQTHQKAIYSKKTQQMMVSAEDRYQLARLAEGTLVFKNERLDRVLEAISRKHQITINTENSQLNRCTVTADFSNQSLEVTMKLLCELVEASYRRSDSEVYISGKGC